MFAPRGFRWSVALACLAIGLLVVGLGRPLLVWAREGPAAADAEASVLSFGLAAIGAAIAVLSWLLRRRHIAAMPPTPEQLETAATILAGLVREQWRAEAQSRALGDPEPMPVRWSLSNRGLMDYPSNINPDAALQFDGRSDRIAPLTEAFRALPRRRLVITGGPGTGKTTLAVQLLLELLAQPGPAEPVPVMFSLVGWVPDRQDRVQDWLAAQLDRTYPALQAIAPDAAATLVAHDRVLPILDGLDEVSPVRAAGILVALNSTLTGGVILTSRRAEYRAAITVGVEPASRGAEDGAENTPAGDVLTAAAAVGPRALTAADAADYLRKNLHPGRGTHAPEWDRVLADLANGAAPDLAAATATPLGLWLIRTVYIEGRLDPSGLADATHSAPTLRSHLLDQLIPAVVRSRPPTARSRRDDSGDPLRPIRPRDPDDLRHWLTMVAAHIRANGTGEWHWWKLPHYTFPTARLRFAVGCAVGVVVGVVLGLAIWLTIGRNLESVPALALGLLSGLTFGFGMVLVIRRRLGPGPPIEPRHVTLRLRGRATEITVRLNRALLLGLACALAFGLATEPVIGLAAGLAVGMGSALIQSATSADVARRVASPNQNYRGDRAAATATVLVASLLMGATVGMTVGPAYGAEAGLILGLTYGPAFGLAYVLSNYAWPLFVITMICSASRRWLPWRVMPMLDDAYRLGLLHTVGSAYRFRHAQLQDHLAARLPDSV